MAQSHVRLLKKARKLIENNKNIYICFALRDSRTYNSSNAEFQIVNFISKSLGDFSTYDGWMAQKHNRIYNRHDYWDVISKQGRLQWIDWMIENHHIFNKQNAKTKN